MHVTTKIEVSADRGADGSITPEVRFSASNPRCLAAERFPTWKDGHFTTAGSVLYFRGGQDYFGSPPDQGWLRPTTPFGRSSLTFGATWAAGAAVRYTYKSNVHEPFEGTVAEATGGFIRVYAGSKRFNTEPFKVKYWQGGRKIKLTCRPATTLFHF